MGLRNIVIEGDPILKKKSRQVEKIDDRLLTLIEDMKETLKKENGVGFYSTLNPASSTASLMSASLTSPDIVIVVIPESKSALASSMPSTSVKHNSTAFTHDGQCMPTTLISFSAIINHLIIVS